MAINTPLDPPDYQSLGASPKPASDAHGAAADLVRQKVAQAYAAEPDANEEAAEAVATPQRSKHQQFMYNLGTSGKDLATIQTEWHNYYQGLSATDKHQVWQEFYASQSTITGRGQDAHAIAEHKQQATSSSQRAKLEATKPKKLRDARSTKELQAAVRDKVTAGGALQAKHHLQSLLFGLGMGLVVIVIFLFGFFNEVIIAPFIQPSRTAASTPLIIDSNSVPPSSTPEVIIPKINVQIPVDYNQTSIEESIIEAGLENGIVHYPTTVRPGELGNAAYFGHSSNNIFNRGKYKFAFVMLRTLVDGDTFYLTYNSKVYVYKVISKRVVDPSEVSVLGPVAGQTATATLITCDPPGTSLKRLVVVGQQITPDPSGNTEGTATTTVTPTDGNTSLPGNGPTLWGRFISTIPGKLVASAVILAAIFLVIRQMRRPGGGIINY